MDDPATEFFEREKRELGDLSDELNFINNSDVIDNADENIGDSDSNFVYKPPSPPKIEPEKIRKWREEFKTRLEIKDKNEQQKIEDLEMTANKELHDWCLRYREQLRITVKNNREDNARLLMEQTKINETASKNDYHVKDTKIWESICKMCNFKPVTNNTNSTANLQNVKEATRMRELLMSLRHTPLVR